MMSIIYVSCFISVQSIPEALLSSRALTSVEAEIAESSRRALAYQCGVFLTATFLLVGRGHVGFCCPSVFSRTKHGKQIATPIGGQ